MFFLQIDSTAVGGGAPEQVKETFFDTLVAGGWTMIPITVLFFLAIYLFIERYMSIKRSDKDPQQFIQTVRSYILAGNIQEAKSFCMKENTPFSRMILKGINRLGSPLRDIALLNPLLHVTGQMRAAMYPTYDGTLTSPLFVAITGLCCLCLGLLVLRTTHRDLVSG